MKLGWTETESLMLRFMVAFSTEAVKQLKSWQNS